MHFKTCGTTSVPSFIQFKPRKDVGGVEKTNFDGTEGWKDGMTEGRTKQTLNAPLPFGHCSDKWQLENWHSQRGPRWVHVTMTLTFDLLTPNSIGVFLSLSSVYVWSMKSLGQKLFELSRYNEVWTDGQTDRRTDRRTDGQTDKVITIGLPHLRWRGPNNNVRNIKFC